MTIVITGLGATTPLGPDVASTWDALLAGRSGVSSITEEWAAELPVQFAASLVEDPASKLERTQARRLDRSSQAALVAAIQAWQDAGLAGSEDVDPDRLGVVVGTGIGGLQTTLSAWDTFREKGARRVSPMTIPMLMSNAPAAAVGLAISARAGVHTPVSACASSNEAIAQGLAMLRSRRADVVMVGGAEASVHPLPLAAFASMQALSRRNDDPTAASRPWDLARDGFVLGEGAAMLVLETLAHAKARGATIYGSLLGAGMSADAHDIVQPDPDGYGQSLAMRLALQDAELLPGQVTHVNAHATSTLQGDLTEAHSIRSVLGSHTDETVVTATKSVTGHLLGAAGAFEALATVLTLRSRLVPATINLTDPDPGADIDIATTVRELPAGDLAAINNSFGFGGHNIALVLSNQHVTPLPPQ